MLQLPSCYCSKDAAPARGHQLRHPGHPPQQRRPRGSIFPREIPKLQGFGDRRMKGLSWAGQLERRGMLIPRLWLLLIIC